MRVHNICLSNSRCIKECEFYFGDPYGNSCFVNLDPVDEESDLVSLAYHRDICHSVLNVTCGMCGFKDTGFCKNNIYREYSVRMFNTNKKHR